MEVSSQQQNPAAQPPSWLSIVTKAKRFSAEAQCHLQNQSNSQNLTAMIPVVVRQARQNGHIHKSKVKIKHHTMDGRQELTLVTSKSDEETATRKPYAYTTHPKKHKRHRTLFPQVDVELPRKVKLELIDSEFGATSSASILTLSSSHSNTSASSSSSPSPGLLSCGSASSTEDDVSSVSTSTSTLSAFSNSPSPKPFLSSHHAHLVFDNSSSVSNDFYENDLHHHHPGSAIQNEEQQQHRHNYINFHSIQGNSFHDARKIPTIPFPSNRISVIRSTESYLRNLTYCDDDDEPEDLSMKKPKTTSSTKLPNNPHDEYECVQDLSARSFTSTTISNLMGSINSNSTKVDDSKFVRGSSLIISSSKSIPPSPSSSPFKMQEKDVSSQPCSPTTLSACSHEVLHDADIKTEENDGELIIADVSPKLDKKRVCVEVDLTQTEARNCEIEMQSSSNETNNIVHDTTTEELQVKETFTKDNYAETEIEVKSRRGRRRKDEEAPGTKFDCFLCSFTSVKENVLKNHMIRMHTVKGIRGVVKCTVCAYACPSLDELRSHQELIHAQGTKDEGSPTEAKVAFHACSHCTKKFRSQSQLEAHLRLIAQKQLWKDLKTRRVM